MSKQNVILKITVTEESVKVKVNGKCNSMSAGLAEAMFEDENLEEVISNALQAVEFRRRQEKNHSEFINDLKTILKEAKKAIEAKESKEKSDKKTAPAKT